MVEAFLKVRLAFEKLYPAFPNNEGSILTLVNLYPLLIK